MSSIDRRNQKYTQNPGSPEAKGGTHVYHPPAPDNYLDARAVRRRAHRLRAWPLAAFWQQVTELFGPEQARVAAEDWVDELEFVDILPEPAGRDWRSVTIAAAARLAKRLNVDADRRTPRDTPADTKVSPILSSNCPAAIRLA
jgi:hypothetical protein